MTKEDSCKPSWRGGGRVSMRRSIRMVIYPGRINRRHPGSSSPRKKRPGCTTFPFRLACQLLPMNAATAVWQQQMTMASADLKATTMFQYNVQQTQGFNNHGTEMKKHQQLRWHSKCSTHTFTRRSGYYCTCCFRIA